MKWKKLGLVFTPQDSLEWMNTHAAAPFADRVDEDLYRIYFSSRDRSNRAQIGFIEVNINDPYKVLFMTEEPILKIGKPGTFDDSGALGDSIVAWGNKKYLYYSGWNLGVTVPFRNSIGLAISEDGGRKFSKYSEGPILDRSIHDPGFAAAPYVLVEGDTWRMWYSSCIGWDEEEGKLKHHYHIKYAESEDGILWRRNGIVCIDFKSNDEYAISVPCVVNDNGIYKMWYSFRGKSYRIGYAESKDGLSWKRKDDEVGIDVSPMGWDSEMIEYPFVFDHQGKRFMLYNGNGYGKTGIGLAGLED